MKKVKNLIDAIHAGSSRKIQSEFESIMSKKISAKINQKKIDILSSVFEQTSGSTLPAGLVEEFDSYAKEDVDKFVASDEYKTLSEESKDLINRYIAQRV